jgi:acetyl esterase/lipase
MEQLNYCKVYKLIDQCAQLTQAYSPELHVTKDTPPTFIYHTFDDQTVPVQQSLSYYEALVKAGVQSELHVFAHGEHGSGLGRGDPALDQWPALLENWLRARGLMTPEAAKP